MVVIGCAWTWRFLELLAKDPRKFPIDISRTFRHMHLAYSEIVHVDGWQAIAHVFRLLAQNLHSSLSKPQITEACEVVYGGLYARSTKEKTSLRSWPSIWQISAPALESLILEDGTGVPSASCYLHDAYAAAQQSLGEVCVHERPYRAMALAQLAFPVPAPTLQGTIRQHLQFASASGCKLKQTNKL